MSEIAASEPQQTTVLDNVRALLPEIKARAEEIEQARAVPRDLAEKLRSAGVFRRYVPRSHGGDEMWPDEGLTVIEELARADASVAWVAAVGSEGPSFYAYLPPDTYDKIFADGPDVIHTGVINPTGKAVRDKGGYRFSGRWSFASGSNNADYICIHGVLDGGSAGPATRLGVVPASEVQIDDVWHVSGLKGTSSNDIVVSDLFIPDEWTGNLRRAAEDRPAPARPAAAAGPLRLGVRRRRRRDRPGGPRRHHRHRPQQDPGHLAQQAGADPVAQYMTGQLATDLYMARTLLHQVARDDQASVAFGPPDDTATVIRRARLSRAASVAASVVEGAYSISGTTGLFESCPLQRRLRDVRAVTQHYMLSARSAYGPVGTAILSEESAG